MLVLTRKVSERFMIGEEIVVTVVKIDGRQVRIGIEAPREVLIRRTELKKQDVEPDPGKESADGRTVFDLHGSIGSAMNDTVQKRQ